MQKSIKKIEFSVLMSVYYKENPNYLKESLLSVLNNTLIPSEIILIEDGKLTDELNRVIEEFEKKYSIIKVIKFEENRGLGQALADGVKFCRYDLIARMDTDDICHRDRFEKQITYLYENNVDVIGSFITEFDETMKIKLDTKSVPVQNLDIKQFIKKRNPFNHMSVCFRKSKVLEVGNYVPMNSFEDYFLWCRMCLNGSNFYNFEESLVDVRAGLSMVTRRGGLKYIKYIYNFEHSIYKIGLITLFEYIKNLIIRVTFAIIPNKVRLLLYKKKLRKENA